MHDDDLDDIHQTTHFDAADEHYKRMPIEPIEVIQAILSPVEYRGYVKGQMLKYSLRAGRKPGSNDVPKYDYYKRLYDECGTTHQ